MRKFSGMVRCPRFGVLRDSVRSVLSRDAVTVEQWSFPSEAIPRAPILAGWRTTVDCCHSEFTLVEMLVVTAILRILTTLLLPVTSKAKDKAHQVRCVGNLKQIGSATQMYINDYNGYLPHAGNQHQFLEATKSWKQLIVPYLNEPETAFNCEHAVFNCPRQDKSCVKSIYGDKDFYGSYGRNWAYLGWRNADELTATIL